MKVGDGRDSTVGVVVGRDVTEGRGCVTDEHALISRRASDRIRHVQAFIQIFIKPSKTKIDLCKKSVSSMYALTEHTYYLAYAG